MIELILGAILLFVIVVVYALLRLDYELENQARNRKATIKACNDPPASAPGLPYGRGRMGHATLVQLEMEARHRKEFSSALENKEGS